MLIKKDEDLWDEDGNELYTDIVTVDWKRFSEEALEDIAKHLDTLGVDVIDYETRSDFWAFRFVKRED